METLPPKTERKLVRTRMFREMVSEKADWLRKKRSEDGP